MVEATPSFVHSTIEVPASVALQESVPVIITARDTEGLVISNSRGRFFVVSIKPPTGDTYMHVAATSDADNTKFRLDVPVADLRVAGEYKVKIFCRVIIMLTHDSLQVWISKAFGYDVVPRLPKMQLPTEEHPILVTVIESGGHQTVLVSNRTHKTNARTYARTCMHAFIRKCTQKVSSAHYLYS